MTASTLTRTVLLLSFGYVVTVGAAEQGSERRSSKWVTEPSAAVTAESVRITPKGAKTRACDVPDPVIVPPIAKVDDFGAKGDGVSDDTEAIITAIRSLRSGGTVVFSSGKTYVKRKTLVLDRPGTYMWGYGATLYALIDDELASRARDRRLQADVASNKINANLSISLLAPKTGVFGLTVISNLRTRLIGTPATTAVYLVNSDQRVIDNRFEYTQNGVLVSGATNFLIARNIVYRTSADGIHVTHGAPPARKPSENGRVVCNVVRENGDDMIALVSYGKGEPQVRNILVEGNDIAGSYWGSGIAVAGGRDITIRHNTISQTPVHAGIRLAAEKSYSTSDVENILIDGNDIEDVETTAPTYSQLGRKVLLTPPYSVDWGTPGKDIHKPPRAAIDISGQASDQKVSRVLVTSNNITRTLIEGILVAGNCMDIRLKGNQMRQIGREAIRITALPGVSIVPANVSCAGDTADGAPVSNKSCSEQPTSANEVSGASLSTGIKN